MVKLQAVDYSSRRDEVNGIALHPAVYCKDGTYHDIFELYRRDELSGSSKVVDRASIMDSAEDVVARLMAVKPEGPCVVLLQEKGTAIYWGKVDAKGRLATYHEKPFSGSQDRYDIPLPEDGQSVLDGDCHYYGSVWRAKVYWHAEDAVSALMDKLNVICDALRSKAALADMKEQQELEAGRLTVERLLAEQDRRRPIAERISSKWDSMTIAEKQKLLDIK